MSPPPAPRGAARGPRQAPGPRSGAGARAPGSAHRPGRASAPGYAARELDRAADVGFDATARDVAAPELREDAGERRARRRWRRSRDPDERAPRKPAPEPAGELTGLRLLLDQLDALLRDPTLALALSRFTAKVRDGMRGLASALRLPRVRLPSWLRLPRLPRWLLAPLLALLLGLGLISLLSRGGDDRGAGSPPSGEIALPGAGMPALQAAPEDPPPARVALVVDGTYAPAALRHELESLGTWLAANHAPGTRVTLIDAATGRASAPLRAADLAHATPTRPAASSSAAAADALRGGGRRLLVGVGAPAPASRATTLTVATRRGATPARSVPVRRGRRARVTIDERRPDALAASVARALIAISGQHERR